MYKRFQLHRISLVAAIFGLLVNGWAGCKKSNDTSISEAQFTVGATVSTGQPMSGSVKGTLKGDSVYTVAGNVFINAGDTLLVQPGVKILMTGNYSFVVQETLLSLGTQQKPVFFTFKDSSKTDVYGANTTADPAYQGHWGGILCETTCPLLVIKWTHIEFGGGVVATSPVSGIANNSNTKPIFFQNPAGIIDLEDSWLYGSLDDNVVIRGGKVQVMRNTFEKSGFVSGEGVSFGSGTVGNCAYNLFTGAATNGVKVTNSGGLNPQVNINVYNNTMIACGYRRNKAGRGGSIDFEEGAKGMAYNNVVINCKYGLRVTGNGTYLGNTLVVADTANLKYGNSLYYADSAGVANQIYPTGFISRPQSTDIPAPTYLPAGYQPGAAYDGSAIVKQNSPLFVNFPLPQTTAQLQDVSFAGSYNFRLQSSSPAVGKGYTGFSPLTAVSVNANFGATVLTLPNKDMGAYPTDGTGNQH